MERYAGFVAAIFANRPMRPSIPPDYLSTSTQFGSSLSVASQSRTTAADDDRYSTYSLNLLSPFKVAPAIYTKYLQVSDFRLLTSFKCCIG